MLKILPLFGGVILPACISASNISPQFEINCLMSQIILNEPAIPLLNAHNLAITIHRVGRQYDLSPRLLSAIMAQESRYKLNSINRRTLDYGIGQINHRTVKYYGFDKGRLLTDLEYSVRASAIVLSDIKRKHAPHELVLSDIECEHTPREVECSRYTIHKGEENWWTRYNSRHHKARAKYKRLVSRFL